MFLNPFSKQFVVMCQCQLDGYLGCYLYFKKSPFPTLDDETPIIPSWRSNKALGKRQINKIIKKIAYKTAEKFTHQPQKQARIKQVSSHWMRHQAASHLGRHLSVEDIAGILRHNDPKTSHQYIHKFYLDLHTNMKNLSLKTSEENLSIEPTDMEILVKEFIKKISTELKTM